MAICHTQYRHKPQHNPTEAATGKAQPRRDIQRCGLYLYAGLWGVKHKINNNLVLINKKRRY